MESANIGNVVSLTTSDGEYEGVVYRKDDCNLILTKVKVLSLGKVMAGNMKFFRTEIKTVRVLEEGKELSKPVLATDNDPRGKRMTRVKDMPAHLKKLDNDINYDVLLNRIPLLSTGSANAYQNTTLPKPLIISEISEAFQEAVHVLKGEEVLGLSSNGVRIGRKGLLCWLSFATTNAVYLFDMLYLGHTGIDNGLKAILEDTRVVKVVHDCRFLSDALYHKYRVKLANVFDSQVADEAVYMQREGTFNTYVRSLSQCLEDYLHLQPDAMFHPRVRSGYQEEDEAKWKERPIPTHLIDAICKEVGHLVPLRVAINKQLLDIVTRGTDIYLNAVKSLPEEDALGQHGFAHLLPAQFKSLVPKIAMSVDAQSHSRGAIKPSGFHSVRVKGCDPYVHFSKDVWHKNQF